MKHNLRYAQVVHLAVYGADRLALQDAEDSSEPDGSSDDKPHDESGEGEQGDESSSSEDSALEKNPTQLARMFEFEVRAGRLTRATFWPHAIPRTYLHVRVTLGTDVRGSRKCS